MPRSTRPIKSTPGGAKLTKRNSDGPRPGAPPKKGQTRKRVAEQGGPKGTPIRSLIEGPQPLHGVASKKTRSRKALAQGIPQYVPEKKRKPGESRHAISPGGPSVDSVAPGRRGSTPSPLGGAKLGGPKSGGPKRVGTRPAGAPKSTARRGADGAPRGRGKASPFTGDAMGPGGEHEIEFDRKGNPRPARPAAAAKPAGTSTSPAASKSRGDRPTQQERLAYGKHPVMELLLAGQVERLFLEEGMQGDRAMNTLEKEARARNIGINWVSEGYFESRIGDNPHQGVLAQVKAYNYADLAEVLEAAQNAKASGQLGRATILLLDGIEDPGNLGGILRTAAGLGIAGVILPTRRSAGVTAAVYKTSAGTVGRIPLARVANLRYALAELKEAGWWSVAATARGERIPAALPTDVPLALVMGAEHDGISPQLEKECDFRVQIPLQCGVESLNVSNATAILLAGMVGMYR